MSTNSIQVNKPWVTTGLGILLLVSFFLPWVSWAGSSMSGYSLPAGDFFKTSESKFGLGNPFPEYDFGFLVFWLIPVLVLGALLLLLKKRRFTPLVYVSVALSLALITVFILFTETLVSLGVGSNLTGMLRPGLFIHGIAAIGLLFSIQPGKYLLKKFAWLLVGPVFAYGSFVFIEKYLEKQTFDDTSNITADFTLSADSLLQEFASNDTASNKKYLDKVIVVTGKATAVELLPDSTSTVQFADSTGSYAIFSLEKNQLDKVKLIKTGDPVSIKGVCSGSIFSEILRTRSISFKRATLNNKL